MLTFQGSYTSCQAPAKSSSRPAYTMSTKVLNTEAMEYTSMSTLCGNNGVNIGTWLIGHRLDLSRTKRGGLADGYLKTNWLQRNGQGF